MDAAASRSSVLRWLVSGLVLLGLGLALGAWIYARLNEPFPIDLWWNELLSDWSPIVGGFSLVMNFLGGGWFGVFVVPLAGAAVLVVIKRPWSAVYFLAAQIVTTAIVQIVKRTLGRARPDEMLVLSDHGSYPSGHVAEAATIAVSLFVIFPRVVTAVLGAAWVVLMAFSRTYLHVHWLSDTVGGALIGAGSALVVAALFARFIVRERKAPPGETAG